MNEKNMLKILLVDDDEDMCESLADVLKLDPAYDISYVTDPFKSLKMIESGNFSLVVVDYKMPEMNGVELLKRIKQVKPNLPCFMLTAFISNELIEEATKGGAEKVLSKFIWPKQILQHIKETIG